MTLGIRDNIDRLKGLKAALEDNTDFQIVVGDYHWNVHKDILVSHSTFFKALVQGPWGESRDKKVSLTDEDAWMVARMIQFFYGEAFAVSQHETMPIKKQSTTNAAASVTQPYRSTYLPSLLTLMQPFQNVAGYREIRDQDSSRSAAEVHGCMYVLADKYDCEEMISFILKCLDQPSFTPASLPKAFSGVFGDLVEGDERLRPVIASQLARCYKDLRAVQSTSDWLELWLASDPALGLLIMDRMTSTEKSAGGDGQDPIFSSSSIDDDLLEKAWTLADEDAGSLSVVPHNPRKRRHWKGTYQSKRRAR